MQGDTIFSAAHNCIALPNSKHPIHPALSAIIKVAESLLDPMITQAIGSYDARVAQVNPWLPGSHFSMILHFNSADNEHILFNLDASHFFLGRLRQTV